jgi:hypothetical protein
MEPKMPRNAPALDSAICDELVADIRAGRPTGRARLYEIFSCGLRVMLGRQVAEPFLSSVVNDVLTDVMWAIQHDELQRPTDLASLIRKSARRRVPVNAPRLPLKPLAVDPEFQEILTSLQSHQLRALLKTYTAGVDERVSASRGMGDAELSSLKTHLRSEFKRIAKARSSLIPA